MMNIVDETGVYAVLGGSIKNRVTDEVRNVSNLPDAGSITNMKSSVFTAKCAAAFKTGAWPMTRHVCKYCRMGRYEHY